MSHFLNTSSISVEEIKNSSSNSDRSFVSSPNSWKQTSNIELESSNDSIANGIDHNNENSSCNHTFSTIMDLSIPSASSLYSIDLSSPPNNILKAPTPSPVRGLSSFYSSETPSDEDDDDNNNSSRGISNISEEERRRIEEEESLKMALALLEQETLELEERQRQFMTTYSNDISPEDFAAIQEVVGDFHHPIRLPSGLDIALNHHHRDDRDDENNNSNDDNEEISRDQSNDSDRWDYDQLLELGQALGDVKTERWQLRASKVINALPTYTHKDITPEMNLKTEPRCVVCLDPYEVEQQVKVLPCKHYFHDVCASGWLASHNWCPICKMELSSGSPNNSK